MASGVTLVRSKMMVPSPAALVHRARICEMIGQGLDRTLTLLSAPAGYGKTSALVDFVRHASVPVCWYTADERDRDLSTFIEYLLGAIAERFPGFGEETRRALLPSDGGLVGDPTAGTGELANEMLGVDEQFALVVDNYESLAGARGFREFLGRLIDILPPNCHLMLASRVLPYVPVTRLVARRQLIGVSEQDLRFTAGEIRHVLRSARIEISASEAEAMATNAEGWITGVLLLADRLRDSSRSGALDLEKASAETYDFLAEEVLNWQPPDIQSFLTTSGVLREMSVQLCQQVLHVRQPEPLLSDVERRNLFVTRFGIGPAATYRYHGLFRRFLQDRLRRRDENQFAQLHLRCAEWFQRADNVEEAVYHFLAAQAFPQATEVMERVAREWFTRGRGETLLGWAEGLPAASRSHAPWVSLYQGRVLTDRHEYEAANGALAHAEAGCAERDDVACLSRIYSQRATIAALRGDYDVTIREAQAALDLLDPEAELERAEAHRWTGRALIGLGRTDEGIAKLRFALTSFRQAGSPYDVVNVLQDLTLAFTAQGRFDDAVVGMNEALAIARRLGAAGQLAGVLNNLATLHSVRGEYQEALALYEEGLAAARRGGDPGGQAYHLIGMADVNRDIGAYERAEPLYDAAWRLAQATEPRVAVYTLTAQADMYRWQGQFSRAASLLARAREVANQTNLPFELSGLLPLAEGILLSESGEVDRGLDMLAQCSRYFEDQEALEYLARARLLTAKALLVAGRQAEAIEAMRETAALADQIGTNHFAVVEGQHSETLVELCISSGVSGCRELAESINDLRSFSAALAQVGDQRGDDQTGRLEVFALGEGRVVRDGRLLTTADWQAAMSKEIFFYILMNGPLERDAIGVEFWPDSTRKKMSNSFHSTLYRVRRAVGQNAIIVEDGYYRVADLNYWFDLDEYETSVERARLLPPQDPQAERLWGQAVSLYQGELLPEVDRMWCVPTRERLGEMHLESLVGLGRCAEARREYDQAIDWYERALAVDELREDICRYIMRSYVRAGMRTKAIERYERCCEVIERELGIGVSEETELLADEIRRGNVQRQLELPMDDN